MRNIMKKISVTCTLVNTEDSSKNLSDYENKIAELARIPMPHADKARHDYVDYMHKLLELKEHDGVTFNKMLSWD